MTPLNAFSAAAGSPATTIAFLSAGLGATVVLLWGGWALLSVWSGWARTRVDSRQFEQAVVRIFLLIVIVLWTLI